MAEPVTFSDLEDAIVEALPELMEASLAELFNQVCWRKVAYRADNDYFVELRLNEDHMCIYCGDACWEGEGNVCPGQFEDAPVEEDYIGRVDRQDMPDDVGFVYDNT